MGAALAENLEKISVLKTPVISVIIGEGGSGGVGSRRRRQGRHAGELHLFGAVPEGFASILLEGCVQGQGCGGTHEADGKRDLRYGYCGRGDPRVWRRCSSGAGEERGGRGRLAGAADKRAVAKDSKRFLPSGMPGTENSAGVHSNREREASFIVAKDIL